MTLHKLLRSPIFVAELPIPSWWAPLPAQPRSLLCFREHPQLAARGCQMEMSLPALWGLPHQQHSGERDVQLVLTGARDFMLPLLESFL